MDIKPLENGTMDDSLNIGGDSSSDNGSLENMIFKDGKKYQFAGNDTIKTSDDSTVGGYNIVKEKAKSEKPIRDLPLPSLDDKAEGKDAISPAKMDFIKTYTKEFDDTVINTTNAVEMVLDSIDKTVKDHDSYISIPDEAAEFLDEKPEDGKVSKFDEAQEIVRTIVAKATDAKQKSEAAAKEASEIYDNIQKFRADTEAEIEDIRSRDEFGNPKVEK